MPSALTPFLRRRILLAAGVTATLIAGPVLVSHAAAEVPGSDEPTVSGPTVSGPTPGAGPASSPTARPGPAEPASAEPGAAGAVVADPSVTVRVDDGFLTWAALDRNTGALATSGGAERNTTESMIKIWVVADHLRRLSESGAAPEPSDLVDARAAIRDSDNVGAQRLYLDGGGDPVVERMIDICGLTDTQVRPGWWSRTTISAPDAVRLGECVADGRAAGPEWTDWVLAEMRQVRGSTAAEDQPLPGGGEGGRWGIIDGLPPSAADQVAIKNGWTRLEETGNWHLNCLGITDDWVLAVTMQYPAEHSLDYGAQRCAEVATQVIDDGGPDPAARR